MFSVPLLMASVICSKLSIPSFDVLSTAVNVPLTVVLRTSNDGIESLEQIREAINRGSEEIR
jgi:RNAse (barnase) inhibitor barstar